MMMLSVGTDGSVMVMEAALLSEDCPTVCPHPSGQETSSTMTDTRWQPLRPPAQVEHRGGMEPARVLITGASSGIGAALARLYAARGARLVLIARDGERLDAIANEVRGTAIAGDIADPVVSAAAVAHAQNAWGGLDVVIANAGYALRGDITHLAHQDLRRQFDTNVFGVVATIQATMPLIQASRGRLVIIGSVAGTVSTSDSIAYAMSKAALRPLAEGLRQHLCTTGVSVTLITPGLVVSDIDRRDHAGRLDSTQMPSPSRLAMPTPVAARKILRSIDRRRRETIITWHAWFLLGAWRWCPWLVRPFLHRARSRRGHDT
jgi:short-subunit dehydrogenase